MSVSDIRSQEKAVDSLYRSFCAGKMAHAYIFAGPDGVGKRTCAREWAKMLMCQEPVENKTGSTLRQDSCGKCASCTLFESDSHPDFKYLYKELVKYTADGKNKITPVDMPIDVIREFLIDKISLRPTMGEWIVYVVDQAERLNPFSQNAMLKVLEEPPAFCVIILLCASLDTMLPTTKSRCRIIRFGPVESNYIVDTLTARGVSAAEARFWAGFCDGSLGQALLWTRIDPGDGLSCYDIKRQLVEKLAVFELSHVTSLAAWLAESARKISSACSAENAGQSKTELNRWAQKGLIRMITAVLSDAMRFNAGLDEGNVNGDQPERIRSLAARFSAEQLAAQVTKTCESTGWIDRSVNEKLIFEELLLNLGSCDIITG